MEDKISGSFDDLNSAYQKFFSKFSEIDSLPIKDWKPLHLVAYFCKKYKDQYDCDYEFKFDKPQPSKCFEIFSIKRIGLLVSSNPEIIKDYIDWVFNNRVKNAKRKLKSISFLITEDLLTEYKNTRSFTNGTIDRTTELMPDIQDVLKRYNLSNIVTYGDFSFLYQTIQVNGGNALSLFKLSEESWEQLLSSLDDNNFDISVLSRVR